MNTFESVSYVSIRLSSAFTEFGKLLKGSHFPAPSNPSVVPIRELTLEVVGLSHPTTSVPAGPGL